MKTKTFPVLLEYWTKKAHPDCPEAIPWHLVAPHAEQARRNHCQSLERLAARGGCSPTELWCLLNDRPYSAAQKEDITVKDAVEFLKRVLADAATLDDPLPAWATPDDGKR